MTLEALSQKKQELSDLLDRKISLIQGLLSAKDEMSSLTTADNQQSLSSFPIESILDLSKSKRKNPTGDLTRRAALLKSCNKILDELDILDGQVRVLVLDLVIEKIKVTLESK